MNTEMGDSGLVSQLIEALRHELHEYGELLALLEHQQEPVPRHVADGVLYSAAAVTSQADRVGEARRWREECRRSVALALQQAEETSLPAPLPMIPEPYLFVVTALVRENNDLLVRVRQRARQNQMLLSRSLELMRRFMDSLAAADQPSTDIGRGTPRANSVAPPPNREAG